MAYCHDTSTGASRHAIRYVAVALLALLCTAAGALSKASPASADTIPTYSFSQLALPAGTLGEPLGLVSAPQGSTLYLSDRTNGVMAINTGNLGASPIQITDVGNDINGFAGPASLALSPDGKTLYLALTLVNAIFVADVSGDGSDANDYTVTGEIQGSTGLPLDYPYGLAVSPNGDTLYISNYSNNTVSVADVSGQSSDPANDTVTGQLSDPHSDLQSPTDLALSPNGQTLYVGNASGPVAVADVSGNAADANDDTVTGTVGNEPSTSGVAVSPDGETLYAADPGGNNVEVVDLSGDADQGQTIGDIQPFGDSAGGLDGLALTPGGTGLYVADESEGAVSEVTIPPAAGPITISGTAQVGSTLTATDSALPPDATVSGQWLADGQPIPGATSPSFTLTPAQLGQTISVTLSANAVGYAANTETSAATATVTSAAAIAPPTGVKHRRVTGRRPWITGKPKVGRKLTAKVAAWTPAPVKLSYQWYAAGKRIRRATRKTLKLTKAQRRKRITVKVTGRKTGYPTVSEISKATKRISS
jgi:DNA-binding beta-propeller fold protein YncE